jgi:hypothetical protein
VATTVAPDRSNSRKKSGRRRGRTPAQTDRKPRAVLRHPVQRVDAGEVEIRIDDRLPERAERHQVLAEFLLGIGLRQDAGARRGRHHNERAGKTRRGKLLGEDRPHRMAKQHRLGGKGFEEGFEFGTVGFHADAD